MAIRRLRFQFHQSMPKLGRLIELARLPHSVGEHGEDFDIIGVTLQPCPSGFDDPIELSRLAECQDQIAKRLLRLWVKFQGSLKLLDGGGQISLSAQTNPQPPMVRTDVTAQFDRSAQRHDRGVRIVRLLVDLGQVRPGIGELRISARRPAQNFAGLLQFPGLPKHRAQRVENHRMVRSDGEQLTIKRFGLGELALNMKAPCRLHRLLEGLLAPCCCPISSTHRTRDPGRRSPPPPARPRRSSPTPKPTSFGW